MLSVYSKMMDVLEKILRILIILLLAVSFLIILAQVVCRYFLHSGAPWMEETARYMIIWLSFLGAPIAIRHGNHMYIDMVEQLFSDTPRIILNLLFDVLLIALCVALFVGGWEYNLDNYKNLSTGLQVSMSWVYSSICVGSVLCILVAVESFCRKIVMKNPHPEKIN